MGPDTPIPPPVAEPSRPGYPAYPGASEPRPRPPLTKRMRTWHWVALDTLVGAVAALCNAAALWPDAANALSRLPLVLLFMALIFVPVALRRLAPVLAFGALLILGILTAVPSPGAAAGVYLCAAYALYTVTVAGRRRTGGFALGLVLSVSVALSVTSPLWHPNSAQAGAFIPVGLACIIAWGMGYSVRQRRRYTVMLQEQAASSAVAEERLRIARELHDVVAHSMSVIAVQAGYGQYVIGSSPDEAREALGAIQATSRDALDEMRRMLGVLRPAEPGLATPGDTQQADRTAGAAPLSEPPQAPGDAVASGDGTKPPGAGATASGGVTAPCGPARRSTAPRTPAPGLAGLGRLISRTGGAGVQVVLEVSGLPRPVPAGIDLSAYRIIQEALTNVVKHAGTGAACTVSVRYDDASLALRVTDDGSGSAGTVLPATTGHGLVGMRERVHLCGGAFAAGPRPAGGFQVTATLPLAPAAAPDPLPAPSSALEPAATPAVPAPDVPAGFPGREARR